jgi:MinD-like ATPase involved in chromosome partitioning or flagellar assembly
MYPVTFYSFKGGVGRTLALVNIAFELSQRGKRVLMVDFDLEAPGLDTFDLSPASGRTPGIVEYVSHYLSTGRPPEVHKYIYEVNDGLGSSGHLWTMPSGIRDDTYEPRLRNIDWSRLYADFDGYLMIDNLKAQWEQTLHPDYVLIDSRTGHTDVAGICTRQLPEAVVLVFLPNEQNLRGLRKIAHDIGIESQAPRNRRITQYFVMSNVPNLDDEEAILAHWIDRFKQELGFRELSQTIHTYQSLSLLDQVIFTKTRPTTQLAKEYRMLADLISRDNPGDREGAIRFLRSVIERTSRLSGGVFTDDESEQHLERIATAFPADGEILVWRAEVRIRQGAFADAMPLLDAAMAAGISNGRTYLRRADCRIAIGDRAGAIDDIWKALKKKDLSEFEAGHALRRLLESSDGFSNVLRDLTQSEVLAELSSKAKAHLVTLLARSHEGLIIAKDLLNQVVEDLSVNEEERQTARGELALALIGLGEFEKAIDELAKGEPDGIIGIHSIQAAFNLAMASWASTGSLSVALFRRVVELHEQSQPQLGANYPQCIAIAYWAVGDTVQAAAQLDAARQTATAIRTDSFSCWRYMTVRSQDFLKDLDEIALMFSGQQMNPSFFGRE